MGRTTKVLGFSVSPELVQEFETIAEAERRTKSELFREMFRVYQLYRQHWDRYDEQWVIDLIAEAKDEQATWSLTDADIQHEEEVLAQYGAQQTKKLGVRFKDIDRLIYAFRKQHPA